MSDQSDTGKLKAEQLQRQLAEERMAQRAPEEDEAAQHERRAEKASYLRTKLEEREQSEREVSR
jgi:hypothetical protein